eukprot:TRINITY_DN1929_c0_g1_i2.p1 TRINITY_DN1929_c0_g1~~TRINITY_DN1929_c0_g1_i2.p1  ORF type:complete len:674 (-),score=187.18 TRINITY_DN1929_c0_g1_i2:495-2516(-)
MLSILGGSDPLSTSFSLFLVQVIIVVVISRALSILLKRIKQPAVIAEVITGILLGPSVFGHIPNFTSKIFPTKSLDIFNVVVNFGLVLFMFVIGLEIDLKLVKNNMGKAFVVSLSAIVLPFVLGIGVSKIIYDIYPSPAGFGNFLLFVGVALSITAFPVLARILSEFKLFDTRVGSVAISCAAVDDVVAWCLLALVVAIVQAGSGLIALYTILVLIGFIIFMIVLVRPLLVALAKYTQNGPNPDGPPPFILMTVILISMLAAAWFTEVIGVHSIFGAFITGVITPRIRGLNARILERIEDVIVIVLVPLYFTYSGLRTDLSTLNNGTAWGLAILVVAAAAIGKITAASICSKLIMKMTWRESLAVGILMNTKGLVELIVLNVGLDTGVLSTQVFSIFVLMAIINTVSTTPLLWLVYLRHLGTKIKTKKEKGLSIGITVKDPRNAVRMVQIMGSLFEQSTFPVHVRAIFLQEISDRPSSYFFSEYYSMWSSAPARRKSHKKTLANTVKQDDSIPSDFTVSSRIFVTSNTSVDIVDYVKNKSFNMVAVALVFPYKEGSKSEWKSLSEFFSTTDMEQTLLDRSDTGIAIVVRKSANVDMDKIERVLYICNGDEHESAALEVLNTMLSHKTPLEGQEYERKVKTLTLVTSQANLPIKGIDSQLEFTQIVNGKFLIDF